MAAALTLRQAIIGGFTIFEEISPCNKDYCRHCSGAAMEWTRFMKATIIFVNYGNGTIAVETEDGKYVVSEIMGAYDIAPGQTVSNQDFTSLGISEYLNITTEETMVVCVLRVCETLDQAREFCRI
jgi:hypothetical protein